MSYTEKELKKELDNKSYEFGFVTDIESEKAPTGLNEDIIRLISSKKKRTSLAFRLSIKSFQSLEDNERA
jgi:Fe-S cluster assembly protein SufB